MKMPSKNVTKVVAGTLATSILAGSCEGYFRDDDSLYTETGFSVQGESAITINYDAEEIQYLKFLDKLSKDIIKQPIVAREFAKNPNLFIKRYGYDKEIDLDEGMLKLILALGDEDIHFAMKNKDIKQVLLLLKEKNLLQNDSYMKINVSEEDRNNALSLLGVEEKDFEQFGACTVAVVCIAYIWVGVVSQAAVAYTAVAAVNAAVGVTVYAWVELWGHKINEEKDLFLDNNPVFKIWGLKGEYKNSYIAADIYLEDEVEKVARGLEDAVPNAFEKISKEQFKQFMKLNLLKSKQ